MEEDSSVLPELRDLETKLGRKVPESLIRSLVAGKQRDKHESAAPRAANRAFCARSADLERLEGKMQFLKQEMVSVTC